MNRRPGQVDVVTEVGYCPSCGRTRNLRREEHHLGQLVRTVVTCETCHRTLSSSIGVATAEPVQAEAEPQPASTPEPEPALEAKAPVRKASVKKAAPAKSAGPTRTTPRGSTGPAARKAVAAKKPAARGGKPTSTATRKNTRNK
jgi:hypothetical protein